MTHTLPVEHQEESMSKVRMYLRRAYHCYQRGAYEMALAFQASAINKLEGVVHANRVGKRD